MNHHRIARRMAFVLAVAVATLAVSACSKLPTGSVGAGDVAVTLADYSIQTDRTVIPAGQVNLRITNTGAMAHELEVLTLPDGVDVNNIPVSGEVAQTDSVGMVALDEVEDILPQGTPTLSLNLAPGRYAFICNLPAHYGLGMRVEVTVQ